MLPKTLLVLLAVPMSLLAQTTEPANLAVNGDFSQTADGKPDQWATSGSKIDVTQILSAEKDAEGKPLARLVCTRCEGRGGDSHAMLVQLGQIKLVKDRPYEFTCRMRASGLRSRTIGIAIQETNGWQKSGLYEQVSLGAAWKKYRIVFRAERDIGPTGRLQIWFSEPGTLDVADVRIVEIAAQPEEFTDIVPPGGGKNLAFNGSFELGAQPACVGQSPLGEVGHAVAFETAKAAVGAVWTEGDEPGGRVTLGSRDGVVLLDVVGRKIAGSTVNLSTSPVYVVGPPGKAKELLAKVKVSQ